MWLDLKYAFRQLAKSPGFTAVVVITLALGIGANTAIFSFFNGVLLRPLPFAEPSRTVLFASGDTGNDWCGLLSADFYDIQKNTQSFSEAAAYSGGPCTLTGIGSPDVVGTASVTDNFFTVLGSSALIGRIFTAEDTRARSGRLAILSYSYWTSKFGGSPDAIGRTIGLDGVSFTVIGIMPPDYRFPVTTDLYVLFGPGLAAARFGVPQSNYGGRGVSVSTIIGRLRPGVSIEQAQAEMVRLVHGLPNPNQTTRRVILVTMRDQSVGRIRPVLEMLLGCVGLVLLIACLNIANLVLARATARRRETAIRLALGASRWQVARQGLTECLLLGLIGGTLGIIFSLWGTHLLVAIAPADVPRLAAVRVDGAVLGFALGLSLLTGVAFGIVPAWEMGSSDPGQSLADGTRGGTSGVERRRFRSALVTIEVALSVVLLVAAGLLLRSFWRMQAVSWGFEPSHLMSMRVALLDPRFASPATKQSIYNRIQNRLSSEPGFESVALGHDRIGRPWAPNWAFVPEGHTYRNRSDMPVANGHFVSPGYFKTLGIPFIKGRPFTPQENQNNRLVVIVDATLARKYFPGGDAVGKHFFTSWTSVNPTDPVEIVGIVGDVKSNGPEAASTDFYFPITQDITPTTYIYVRTQLPLATCVAAVQRVVAEIDPSVPVSDVATMDAVVARPALGRRFPLILIGAFAGLALFLAAIGIYAVVSYSVAQRTREIGIRMALGAQASDVTRLIVRQGAVPIAIGLTFGLCASAFMAFAIRKMLFEVPPFDAVTFTAIPALLAVIAVFACWLPSQRAARIDPVVALRTY
jgi:predicted permease